MPKRTIVPDRRETKAPAETPDPAIGEVDLTQEDLDAVAGGAAEDAVGPMTEVPACTSDCTAGPLTMSCC